MKKRPVPGFRVLSALGMAPQARGLLYHRLFSSNEAGFKSEPCEYRQAVSSMGSALAREGIEPEVTWLLDRAFDDWAFWDVGWKQGTICFAAYSIWTLGYRHRTS